MLGLPRGGVVVASEVAQILGLPLDVLIVRKIGHPLHREFAVGALAEGEVVVLDDAVIGTNPIVRSELEHHDPRMFALQKKLWGMPEAAK